MAALTWRNVDAPDFRTSLQGYEAFSRLFGDAVGGLQGGLKRYDDTISDQVNNALQLRIAAAQDPAAAQAMLSGLPEDPNARRVSGQTLNLAMNRPNALIDQALNQQKLDQTAYNFDRSKSFDSAEDRAAQFVLARNQAYAQGKGAEWDAANPEALKGLSLAATRQMYSDGTDARYGNLRNQGTEISNDQGRLGIEEGRFSLDNAKTDRASTMAAGEFISQYLNSGRDIGDLDGALATSGLPGNAQLIVRQQFGLTGVPSYGGGIPSGSSVPGGADPSRIMNYQARAAGFASVPESVTTLGGASDFAKAVNNAGVPSSAMGVYQIVGSTMRSYGPKVFGNNWRNVDYNVENQDKLAKAIFEDNRGSAQALRNQWVSLSPAMAERIRKMPWEQARQYIAQGESGADPGALLLGSVIAQRASDNQKSNTNSASAVVTSVGKALGDTRALPEVVSSLTKDGPLKGASANFVATQIERIKTAAATGRNPIRLTDAAAGEVLRRSLRANDNNFWTNNVPGWLGGNEGTVNDDWIIDDKAIRSNIDQIRPGAGDATLATNAAISVRDNQVQAAQNAYSQASARLADARARAARNPAFDKRTLGRLVLEEALAAKAYETAISSQISAGRASGSYPRPKALPRGTDVTPFLDPSRVNRSLLKNR